MTGHECRTFSSNNKQKILSFRMTSLQYFDNISFHISPNNKEFDISKIYTKWAVENCPIWNFQTPRKLRDSKNKSGHWFAGHPVDEKAKKTDSHTLYIIGVHYTKVILKNTKETRVNCRHGSRIRILSSLFVCFFPHAQPHENLNVTEKILSF